MGSQGIAVRTFGREEQKFGRASLFPPLHDLPIMPESSASSAEVVMSVRFIYSQDQLRSREDLRRDISAFKVRPF